MSIAVRNNWATLGAVLFLLLEMVENEYYFFLVSCRLFPYYVLVLKEHKSQTHVWACLFRIMYCIIFSANLVELETGKRNS